MTTASPRLLAVTAIAAAALLGLTACDGGAAPTTGAVSYELTATTPEPVGDIDSFTWALFAEPYSLSYFRAFDYAPNQVLANVCESLLRWNPDLSISPGLATAVANPTPTTWVYTIRDGVTFHDGTTLTADDVVASLSMHLDPAVGSPWGAAYRNVASIEKTGDLEVTVTTTVPDSQFNQFMAAAPGVVESAATLAADGEEYGNPSTGVNCTGPFAFDSWSPGQSLTLTRYDDYWDADNAAKAGKVTFVFLPDANARVNAMSTGDVDGAWQVPTGGISTLQASGAGSMFFGVNTTTVDAIISDLDGPLGDPVVRQALLTAIDREGLIATAENGYAEVADALAPRSTWAGLPDTAVDAAFDELTRYDYDLDAARALVADAGIAGEPLVIAVSNSTPGEAILAQAIAAGAEAIGLKPEIRTIPADQYGALFVDPAAREGIDLFYTMWYLSTTDPMEMYGIFLDGEFSNYGNWSDPAYTDAIQAATVELDPAARAPHVAVAQKIVNEQLPWLPLYTTPTTVWLGERITGVAPSIDFLYYPWAASIGAAG